MPRESLKPTPLHDTPPVSYRESEVVFLPFADVKTRSSPDLFCAHSLRVQLESSCLEFVCVIDRPLCAVENARILPKLGEFIAREYCSHIPLLATNLTKENLTPPRVYFLGYRSFVALYNHARTHFTNPLCSFASRALRRPPRSPPPPPPPPPPP